ncbi:DUF1893 domain-containing protein [candidate division WOR-3 bacterium]|nr:DUF1893 domain-containing protein [candidate division WOR-3 bacterium]
MRGPAITDPLTRLELSGLSLLVLRDDVELYESWVDGVRPLLELVDWFPGGLHGATVADRVVGACAARVFAHLEVNRVLGITGSLSAERILVTAGIEYEFRHVVTEIRNLSNTGVCPFEQLSAQHSDPKQFITAIRDRLAELQKAGPTRRPARLS